MSARQPLPPEARHSEPEPLQRFRIARDSVIAVVATQFLPQCAMLLRDRPVPVDPTPWRDPPKRAPKTTRRRLAPHHPVATPGACPVGTEPQEIERPWWR